jgi:hypothetical protein
MNCESFSYNQLLKTSSKCNSAVATEATAMEIWRLLETSGLHKYYLNETTKFGF